MKDAGKSNGFSCFVVGRPGPEYGLPVVFFIRKSQQRTIIKGLSFFVVAGLTAMWVYMKE